MDKTKIPSPTNPFNLLSILISPLESQQCQLCPRRRGIVGYPSDIFTANVDCEGEVRHIPDKGGRNFVQYPEVDTVSVAREVETTKSGYFTFDPGEMSTINWSPTGGQVSKSIRSPRSEPSSDTSNNPTGSSDIPTPEEFCKMFTCTSRLE